MSFEIEQHERDGIPVVALSGRFVAGEPLEQFRPVVEALQAQGHKSAVLDMTGVNYIDSSALGALVVAHDVIAAAGGVPGLVRLGIDELDRIAGVGPTRAARLLAAVELGRRTLFGDTDERPQLLSPKDLADYLMPRYAGHAVERFGVVLLDQKCRVLRNVILSVGTTESVTSLHLRDVFRAAVLASASTLAVFHNHPTGDPQPSPADRLLTLDILRCDDDVRRMLSGDDAGYSERHRQRRVRATTGLTRKQIDQLARAREAFAMLLQGVPASECAARSGFSDQAHLTRSLRTFHGQTPAQVLSGG